MNDWHPALDAAVRQAGFFTNGLEKMGGWERTTVCSQRLPGGMGYGGNSFWVTRLADGWYLGTWGCRLYRLPEADRIAELCVAWLSRVPDRLPPDFDDALKRDFGLVAISEDEFETAVYG